ncbi:MAG TPA: tetratricopeptide repeat protein, partial [Thermodesulfovibrionales bacterium]|nr:tetratricopeptide repeat protein [Thermodesulfovibrionales bacterium]
MGKVFHKDKLRPFKMRGVFAAVFIAVLLMTVPDSRASYREFELFDKAYELYLSYQPEKAAETFGVFLKEFPQSSAADAALFWLGRCYLQLKLYGEAEKYFS